MKQFFIKKVPINKSSGFSLPEILVSVFIIAIITSVVVFNQGDFNDRISLKSAADDLELQIREAQVYSISVREFQPSTNEFTSSYGVHFNLDSTTGSNNSYLFFADRGTQNGIYGGTIACLTGGANECIRRLTLTRNNTISDVCAILSDSSERCFSGGHVERVDVVFSRPDPSAKISFFNLSGSPVTYPNHLGAKIVVRSPKGNTNQVYVYVTGQLSVQ